MSEARVVTIAEKWRTYMKAVGFYRDLTPPLQIQETRRAFHAGFWSCLMTMKALAMLSDEEACTMLAELEAEGEVFKNDVGTRREPREG